MQPTEGSRVVIISFPFNVCDPLGDRVGVSLGWGLLGAQRQFLLWTSQKTILFSIRSKPGSSGEFCELCESPCCCCSLSHVRFFVIPWTAACQASLSFTVSWSFLKFMSIESVVPPNHLILCHLLLLLPSIFSSIKVFSNEPAIHIRWPKYWSFSISPSNEYSALIRIPLGLTDVPKGSLWPLRNTAEEAAWILEGKRVVSAHGPCKETSGGGETQLAHWARS